MPILLAICLFQVEVTAKVTRPSAGAAASWPWSPASQALCWPLVHKMPLSAGPRVPRHTSKPGHLNHQGLAQRSPESALAFIVARSKRRRAPFLFQSDGLQSPFSPERPELYTPHHEEEARPRTEPTQGIVPRCPSVGIKEPWLGPGPTATPGHSALHHRTAAESWASAEALDPEEGGQPINQASAHMVLCQVIFITKRFK